MQKKHDDLFAGLLFVAVAILVATQLSSIKITDIAMGSRMLPNICMILLFALGGILIVKWLIETALNRKRANAESATEENNKNVPKDSKITWAPTLRVLLCIFFFAVFVALMKPIGFILSGIIYLACSFAVIVPNAFKKKPMYVISIVVPVAVYFLFTEAFSLLLPTGTLW